MLEGPLPIGAFVDGNSGELLAEVLLKDVVKVEISCDELDEDKGSLEIMELDDIMPEGPWVCAAGELMDEDEEAGVGPSLVNTAPDVCCDGFVADLRVLDVWIEMAAGCVTGKSSDANIS